MSLDRNHGKDQIIELLDNFYKKTGFLASMYLVGDSKPIYSNESGLKSCEGFCGNRDYYRLLDTQDNIHTCENGLWCRLVPIEIEESCFGFFLIQRRRIADNEANNFETEDFKKNLDQLLKIKITTIIELMVAKRQIRSENELLSLAARIRHIIYQPLQALIGMADNLSNEIEDAEVKDIAIKLKDELIKLSYNIGPLNDWNYVSKKQTYYFSKVDVISILDGIVDLFRDEAKFKGIEIHDPIIHDLPTNYIEASEPHIRQIFYNILHNAVKYSYSSSKFNKRYINIYCTAVKNYLCIKISNYGVGILQNEIDDGLIFQEGYRGELSRDRWRTGSGLGLSVAKKLVEDDGGKIKIQSKKLISNEETDACKTDAMIYLPFTQKGD